MSTVIINKQFIFCSKKRLMPNRRWCELASTFLADEHEANQKTDFTIGLSRTNIR